MSNTKLKTNSDMVRLYQRVLLKYLKKKRENTNKLKPYKETVTIK